MKTEQLWEKLDQIPEETVERLGLEDMLLDGNLDKAKKIIEKIISFREENISKIVSYHTTNRKYEIGENIFPQNSQGKYQGKLFVSKSLETAFIGDNPRFCYQVQVDSWRQDPEDLTKEDWGYTLTPAKVLKEIPMSEVLRAKR